MNKEKIMLYATISFVIGFISLLFMDEKMIMKFAVPVIGLLFLILGIVFLIKHIKFLKITKEAEAIITKITKNQVKSRSSSGKIYHKTEVTAYVKYTVGGKDYKGMVSPYKKRGLEGDKVIILYDPNNPQKMRGKEGILPFIGFPIMAIMGLMVLILSLT